jgi:hypothetical protein
MHPSVSWLQGSRDDLVTALMRSGRTADAEQLRAEGGVPQPGTR